MRRALAAAWEAVDAALLWLAFEPAGRWARWRERRELRHDITSTAALVLAVAAFFVLIAAVCVAVFLFN